MIRKTWEDLYLKRQTNAQLAISTIKSFQRVFLAPFCNEPITLVNELVQQKERLKEVQICNVVIGSPCSYADSSCHSSFKISTFLSSPRLKNAFLNNVADYLPVSLSEIPNWLTQAEIDVALIQVSPPDKEGYCNLGISVDIVQSLIKTSKFVIAQVNNYLPYSYGDTRVHVSEIDQFVLADDPLLTLKQENATEEEITIGKNVAQLIPDKATIQVGVGRISDSILLSLTDKKELGVHSGSITDAVMELMNLGVVTNEWKEIDRFKTVCTTVTGTDNLYRFINKNKEVELHAANYTHNDAVISKISNFHSINSALEVDLFGQVNAEQVGSYPVGGVGGQMDFIRGARRSRNGKAIIALPSTAKNGTTSRIKVKVSKVTSIKSEIDYVVTEYGIAKLFGKTLRERAEALIAIAHPNFREQLLQDIQQNNMV